MFSCSFLWNIVELISQHIQTDKRYVKKLTMSMPIYPQTNEYVNIYREGCVLKVTEKFFLM